MSRWCVPGQAVQVTSQIAKDAEVIPNLYSIQTDFGLMEFDSDSVLGYWWTRIMNGESMFDLAKPVVSQDVQEVIK